MLTEDAAVQGVSKGREGWSFHTTPDGWVWAYVNPETHERKASTSAFPGFIDCVEDAARNGYLNPRLP